MSEQGNQDVERGLYGKYEVLKDGEPQDGCFVLKPESDPAALQALAAYVHHSDNKELNRDLMDWIVQIQNGGSDG